MAHVQILDTIKDPGPKPDDPGDEPTGSSELRMIWFKKNREHSDWLVNSRRFQLAQKIKLIESMPIDKRTPVEDAVVILGMIVLAKEAGEPDIFRALGF